MKQFLLGLATSGLVAFTIATNKSNAEVEQIQGLYVFVKAKPTTEYDFLGTVTGPAVSSHEFDILLEKFLKKTKKEFPSADAIIFDSGIRQSHNTKVSVIKFK